MTPPSPIITSVLDTDAYKLHMQQAVFHQNPHVVASYEFQCRNKDDYLGGYAALIEEQVACMANVCLTEDEYKYLSTLPYFSRDYLDYLREYRFNPAQVTVRVVQAVLPAKHPSYPVEDGTTYLAITVDGPWVETILWEIPLLAIVSELVQRMRHPNVGVPQALATLHARLDDLFARHTEEELASFAVSDFGTRRRFSRAVQEAVVRTLQSHPRFGAHLVGTSNYDLARRLHLPAVGTQAHEWFQAFQQLAPQLRLSQTMALEKWLHEYPSTLGIALTDCITMDTFLLDFTPDLAHAYAGLRQDSGDPVEWGHKAILHYRSLGIDPATKVLVFSDGLTLDRAVELYNTFKGETRVMCGIGTQLTCSIDAVKPLNTVIKMVRCQGRPVAKVSDSPGKSISGDARFVEQLIKAFNLTPRCHPVSC